jgi:putative transposase
MHRNLFQRRETADLVINTIFRYRDAGEFKLHEFVVMPDHIHLLLTVATGSSIQRAMQLIKGGFSHDLRESGKRLNAVWQPRYHDRRIRDGNEYAEIARYIRENPIRRGLVGLVEQWPHSSASNVARLDGPPQGLTPRTLSTETRDAGLKARSTEELTNVLS